MEALSKRTISAAWAITYTAVVLERAYSPLHSALEVLYDEILCVMSWVWDIVSVETDPMVVLNGFREVLV